AHHARHDGEDDVEGADVLVVGGQEPAGEEARLVVVIVVMGDCGGHDVGLAFSYWAASAASAAGATSVSVASASGGAAAAPTAPPSAGSAPGMAPPRSAIQASNSAWVTTLICRGMKAWSTPHSSEH